ncbi:MAG: ACP S-malonyltransferase [Proteobacteria bacterium]|nr:ACP S-malonyltransferase [Pseudomonadota bacterium]
MNKTISAVVFPGQGSQRHGMGLDFYNTFLDAKLCFEEASDALGWDVAALCFGDDPLLHMTEYAQPCILTTEIAMYQSLVNRFPFSPSYFGGHSLGEYTALVAAGVVPLNDAVKIVNARGKLMQIACPEGIGGMAALISDDINMGDLRDLIWGLDVDIANINSENQIVLSGDTTALKTIERKLSHSSMGKGIRFVPLTVSAAFHSRFMAVIKEDFKEILLHFSNSFNFKNAHTVTSNFRGGFHSTKATEVLNDLVSQIAAPVNWLENMDMLSGRATNIIEVGPGRPLRAFFNSKGINCLSLTTVVSVERTFGIRETMAC